MEYITKSAEETENLGRMLACEMKGGEIISLVGDLGGGKTTFIKGFARGLGIKKNITSPTFLVMREYAINQKNIYPAPFCKREKRKMPKAPVKRCGIKKLYHFDAYRIKNSKEFLDFGFKEILKEKNRIILIEWADRVAEILPPHQNFWRGGVPLKLLTIKFDFFGENKRKITFSI